MKVNINSGVVCTSGLDFRLSGFVPIEVARYYSSNCERKGLFGNNWASPLDITLIQQEKGWVYRDAFGIERNLELTPFQVNPWLTLSPERPLLVTEREEAISLLTNQNLRVWFGNPWEGSSDLRILKVEDRNGNALNYHYLQGQLNSIFDDMGRHLTIKYTERGLIHSLTLSWSTRNSEVRRMATYEYDQHDNLILYQDAVGSRWSYAYLDRLLVLEGNPLGGKEYASYDKFRRCIAIWRSDGNRLRQMEYDVKKGSSKITNARGQSEIYRYEDGKLLEQVNPLGESTNSFYDGAGNLIGSSGARADGMSVVKKTEYSTQFIHANGATSEITNTFDGHPKEMVDAEGKVWRWEYDDSGNVIKKITPSGGKTEYRYERGFLTERIDANGHSFRQRLLRNDGTIELEDDLGFVMRLEFDLLGFLATLTDAQGQRVTIDRDLMGKIISVTYPNQLHKTYRRNALGLPTEIRNQLSEVETYRYDTFGEVISHTDSLGRTSYLNYGVEELLLEVRFPDQSKNLFEYDELGRVITQRFYDGRVETYEYDEMQRLREINNGSNESLKFTYNEVGLLISKETANKTIANFDYSILRNLATVKMHNVEVSFIYDDEGRIVEEGQNGSSIHYHYNQGGDCVGWEIDEETIISYTYDARGRLVGLEDANAGKFEFLYDKINQLTMIKYPNEAKLFYEYDSKGQLTHQRVEREAAVLFKIDYRYDERGRLIEVCSGKTVYRYQFNSEDELVCVWTDETPEMYYYDAVGNLLSRGSMEVKYDESRRLKSFGNTTLEYDSRGYVTTRIEQDKISNYYYDLDGFLVRYSVDDQVEIQYVYDNAARLLSRTKNGAATTYLWSGSLPLVERRDDGSQVINLYHPQLFLPIARIINGKTQYLIPNWKGMVIGAFDDNGKIEEYDYTPFGALKSASSDKSPHPFRLPGQIYDEDMNLHYNRFRFYIPEMGRFLTPDPIGLMGGLNLYAYANNPIQGIDLLGLCDGEVFYRTMSDAEAKKVMENCKLENKPNEPCHDLFVTQRKDYSEKLMERHPKVYPKLAEFCVNRGTVPALQNPAISAVSSSNAAGQMFPNHSTNVSGPNIIHLKFEQVNRRADKALNYGLRRGQIGVFNNNIKKAKILPNGPECNGPAA